MGKVDLVQASVSVALACAVVVILNHSGLLAAEKGDVITGYAEVVDGDTLLLDGNRIRLFGIDAPEREQMCVGSSSIRCGDLATNELDRLVGGTSIRCVVEDLDSYGRLVSTCYSGNDDLNGAMVRSGLAVAYRYFTDRYVEAELLARREGRGLWGTRFVMPWDWRRGDRL